MKKKFVLVLVDIVFLYTALWLTLLVRYQYDWGISLGFHLVPFTILFIVWLFVFYIANLYEIHVLKNGPSFYANFFRVLIINAVIGIVFFYLIPLFGIAPRRNFFIFLAFFAGIVLLDDTGTQLGISKTLNSDHKATVGDTVTIKAGQSKTFTIAGNIAASASVSPGQVASLSVTGVTTSATVSGSLPITGAGHTMNTSLTIGSVTMAIGANDPQNNPSKEIGTTGYTFSAVKITAGSAEKVRVKSIR